MIDVRHHEAADHEEQVDGKITLVDEESVRVEMGVRRPILK
jgi:hypothetical protein